METRHGRGIVVLAVLAALVIAGAWAHPAEAGVLDGKTFAGPVGEMGKDASAEDTVRFEDGKLHSLACDKYDFTMGEYTTRMEGGKVHFEATTRNPRNATIRWEGVVDGDRIDATYTLTTKEKTSEKWFKGELK